MVYRAHFGLRESPFGITPDTSYFFACASIQKALNTLVVAVANGEGFIKVTGEVGTGKTLLCRKFLSTLDDNWVSAYLPNPTMNPDSLLHALADEIGVKLGERMDQHRVIKAINLRLLDLARERKRVVVCLDEAQAVPYETLETLRLLTNLETEKRKLLQVILFGQPELDARLSEESVRQLRQRITFQHTLGRMTRDETGHYLAHRLAVAGYRGGPIFARGAVRKIYKASRGVPRLINILANKAMMLAFGEGRHRVGWRHVNAAAADTPASLTRTYLWIWVVAAGIIGSGIGWLLVR